MGVVVRGGDLSGDVCGCALVFIFVVVVFVEI